MRSHWIICWMLSVSVMGCAVPGLPGSGKQLAGQSQAEQIAALNQGGTPPQKQGGWTQKVTNVLTGKSNQLIGPSKPKARPDLDPISLDYASGPPNADLYLSMAKLSDQGGNIAHARSMYQRALTMQPENLEGMLGLARLEDREGQLDAALHYYKQAVQLHPPSAKALNDLALCYARRGQLNEAVPPLEQAIRMQPTKLLYRNNIAKVLTEMNQIDGALQHLSAVHPPGVAQYNMGVLLNQRGRNEEAVRFLAEAKQIDPRLAAASTLLAQLTGRPQQKIAQGAPGPYDHVLPTSRTTPGQPYPSTGVISATPRYQTVPAETARMPVGHSPATLPPVR